MYENIIRGVTTTDTGRTFVQDGFVAHTDSSDVHKCASVGARREKNGCAGTVWRVTDRRNGGEKEMISGPKRSKDGEVKTLAATLVVVVVMLLLLMLLHCAHEGARGRKRGRGHRGELIS